MNRLQRRTFIASTGVHGLLAAVLIFCPAFLAPGPKVPETSLITIYPDIPTDEPIAKAAGPPGRLPPAALPEPRPQPLRGAAPPNVEPDSLQRPKQPGKSKPVVDFRHVITRPAPGLTSTDNSPNDHQERTQREWKGQFAGQIDRTIAGIAPGRSTPIALPTVPGSGDNAVSIGSYGALVRSVYQNAWIVPEDAASNDATVEVTVTIGSDGTVVASRITRPSGDSAVDASVQRALGRVTTIGRPFPNGPSDQERTYRIPFNLKTTRGTA